MKLLKQALRETRSLVDSLSDETWDQSCGCMADLPCCIGAHLARHWQDSIRKDSPDAISAGDRMLDHDWVAGREALAERAGISTRDLDKCLFVAGAPRYPFGHLAWEDHVSEVWERLSMIERVPTDRDLAARHEFGCRALQCHPEKFDCILSKKGCVRKLEQLFSVGRS